jgi:hypothetical protein
MVIVIPTVLLNLGDGAAFADTPDPCQISDFKPPTRIKSFPKKQLRSQMPLRITIRQRNAQDMHWWFGFGIERLMFNSPLSPPSVIYLLRLLRSEIDAPGWVWGFLDCT